MSGLADNLEAFYRNNGTDHSGKERTLPPVGTPGTAPGIDGTPDAAGLVQSTTNFYFSGAFNVALTEQSFAIWMRLVSPGAIYETFSAAQVVGEVDYTVIHIGEDATKKVAGVVNAVKPGAFAAAANVWDTNEIRDGGWHHFASTWGAGIAKLYIDGTLRDSKPAVGSGTKTWPYMQLIGGDDDVPTPWQNLGVWSRTLTQDDVSQLAAGVDPTAPSAAVESSNTQGMAQGIGFD